MSDYVPATGDFAIIHFNGATRPRRAIYATMHDSGISYWVTENNVKYTHGSPLIRNIVRVRVPGEPKSDPAPAPSVFDTLLKVATSAVMDQAVQRSQPAQAQAQDVWRTVTDTVRSFIEDFAEKTPDPDPEPEPRFKEPTKYGTIVVLDTPSDKWMLGLKGEWFNSSGDTTTWSEIAPRVTEVKD